MKRALARLIVAIYPSAIRRAHPNEMEDVLAFCLHQQFARRRGLSRTFVWIRGFADSVAFAVTSRTGYHPPTPAAAGADRNRFWRPSMFTSDIKTTLRGLRKQPGWSAAIVLMLALGIGATTSIFSVVYGVLLKPLAFPDPDRIVQVWASVNSRGIPQTTLTEANFWDMRDRNRSFENFGAWHGASFTLTGVETPERVNGALVSVGFFKALGVQPVAGRLFDNGEDEPSAPQRRVMLSHAFWQRHYATDTTIVGKTITMDGAPYDVVGILPAGTPWLDNADVFVPFRRRLDADRTSWEYVAVGRLKAGITIEAAQEDLTRVARDLEAQFPQNKGIGASIQPSRVWVATDQLRQTLWILLGAVGLLLVIAGVNVTNLLLARASSRVRESAVRTALGASRGDLIRERLTESLLLSGLGAALGWAMAIGLLNIMRTLDPGGIPRLADVTLNGSVLAFSAAVTIVVGVVTGLLPALQSPFANIAPALRHGARGTSGDTRSNRLRSVFVGAEVALSLMLLVGAGLLVRSMTRVLTIDRGFQSDNRLLVNIGIPRSYGPDRMKQITTDVIASLERMPAIESVASVSGRPLGPGSTGLGIVAADAPDTAATAVPWASWRIVTKDYFKVMGLPVLLGRTFTADEEAAKPWRAIVSKRLADLLWPGQNPIGRTAILWKGQGDNRAEVVGVVADMRERGLEADPTLAVYFPAGNSASTTLQLVMHTRGKPEDAVPAVRGIVSAIDPLLPISNVRSLDDMVTTSVATRRFTMLLLASFAGLALLLSLAGVYGVLAYSVARRVPEIGVRLALGAKHARLLGVVVAQGMRAVFIGAIIGAAGAFWLSRLMTSLLFGVTATDPLTYAVVFAALLVTAILACYIPARQVLRVDPVIALRSE